MLDWKEYVFWNQKILDLKPGPIFIQKVHLTLSLILSLKK